MLLIFYTFSSNPVFFSQSSPRLVSASTLRCGMITSAISASVNQSPATHPKSAPKTEPFFLLATITPWKQHFPAAKSHKIEKTNNVVEKNTKCLFLLTVCEEFHWRSDFNRGVRGIGAQAVCMQTFFIGVLLLFTGGFSWSF